jgi:hypothetical protein
VLIIPDDEYKQWAHHDQPWEAKMMSDNAAAAAVSMLHLFLGMWRNCAVHQRCNMVHHDSERGASTLLTEMVYGWRGWCMAVWLGVVHGKKDNAL